MKTTERLAVITALEKAIKPAKDAVRAEAYEELMYAYQTDGYEKQKLRVNGEDVGELILTKKPGRYVITDQEALNDFALGYGFGTIRHEIKPYMMEKAVEIIEGFVGGEFISEYVDTNVDLDPAWEATLTHVGDIVTFKDSGLMVPGVKYIPEYKAGMQVRGCDPLKVLPLVNSLDGVERILLEAGDE